MCDYVVLEYDFDVAFPRFSGSEKECQDYLWGMEKEVTEDGQTMILQRLEAMKNAEKVNWSDEWRYFMKGNEFRHDSFQELQAAIEECENGTALERYVQRTMKSFDMVKIG